MPFYLSEELTDIGGMIKYIHESVPLFDRIVVPVGAIVASWGLSEWHSVAGLIVAILTIFLLIPRIFMGWEDWAERRKAASKPLKPTAGGSSSSSSKS